MTGREQPPTLPELVFCKDLFLGDRKAIQIFPRKTEAVDAGTRTLHVYAALESDSLPAFRQREPITTEAR